MKTSSVAVLCIAVLFSAACAIEEGDGPGDCADPTMFYPDTDGDGFGDTASGSLKCEQPAGLIATRGDCNDDDRTVHPDAKEICDGRDNDCDDLMDDADSSLDVNTTGTYYPDSDGDGYGIPASSPRRACVQPVGFATSSNDCDDAASAVNPSAKEVCDFIDNDCDAKIDIADTNIDPASLKTFYRDIDRDNFGSATTVVACNAPTGYVLAAGDCNDNDITAFPGGTEVCDGVDNDCDGGNDGTAAQPNRCTALVGTYGGSYTHTAQEKLGSSVINTMTCNGTGSGSLALNRKPGLQGTFTCVYPSGGGLFAVNQSVTIKANVGLTGAVTGTVEHTYDWDLKRTYNVTGTQTATSLMLSGTGSFYPHTMSAVPWQVTYSFTTSR